MHRTDPSLRPGLVGRGHIGRAGRAAGPEARQARWFRGQRLPVSAEDAKEALQSAVKALEGKRVNYLVAQIADPAYVDNSIAEYKKFFQKGPEAGKTFLAFDRLVREVTTYYTEDPELLNELRRFAKDGEWDAKEDKASATVKALPGRQVFMKKLEGRWFLENRQQ